MVQLQILEGPCNITRMIYYNYQNDLIMSITVTIHTDKEREGAIREL